MTKGLGDAAPIFINWFEKIRQGDVASEDLSLLNKINAAEDVVKTIVQGINVRETLRQYAESLTSFRHPKDHSLVELGGKQLNFEHMRIGAVAGLLSSIWGVYDNVVQVCTLLLGMEGEVDCPRNLFGLMEHKRISINGNIIGRIRQKYRFPVALSYQIRNSVMHRLPHVSDRPGAFVSLVATEGYLISASNYQELLKHCRDRNGIKEAEIEKLGIIDKTNQCLLQVLDLLQPHTDACAVEIMQATLNPLIPPGEK